ncbi:hypothetical protein CAP36_15545 [Chitinophagaceae bacterium IBVUCB2]|nr:hypothetical protein CAP36_15545 [Chitinophagaceae bacterium IBVUCB2]
MKHINFFAAIATSIVIISCGSSDKETQATQPTVVEGNTPSTTSTATPATNSSTIAAPVIPTNSATTPTQAANTTSSALNPEHGKPGHRCDIAVGAPLNSKPTTPTVATPTISTPTSVSQPVVTQNSPVVNSSKPVTATKSAAGINPAHGQPGHRCDIAVGASLDSKPIQASIQQPATTSTPALPYTPVNIQPAATTVAKGMNPAHGQPGHRCEIAVGAPLDSKPTTPAVTTEATKPKQ